LTLSAGLVVAQAERSFLTDTDEDRQSPVNLVVDGTREPSTRRLATFCILPTLDPGYDLGQNGLEFVGERQALAATRTILDNSVFSCFDNPLDSSAAWPAFQSSVSPALQQAVKLQVVPRRSAFPPGQQCLACIRILEETRHDAGLQFSTRRATIL